MRVNLERHVAPRRVPEDRVDESLINAGFRGKRRKSVPGIVRRVPDRLDHRVHLLVIRAGLGHILPHEGQDLVRDRDFPDACCRLRMGDGDLLEVEIHVLVI